MAKIAETPLMTQYAEMKKKHPDAVLLFRVGDFYETFSDDAITASEILGITLTRRANGKAASVELAGFPHHALDTYLPKLVRAGKRVAICEQLEDPKTTKKLVKRGITELVTPGVNTNDASIPSGRNNFLAGIQFPGKKNKEYGIAFLDITTGEFACAQGDKDFIDKLIGNIAPAEMLLIRGFRNYFRENFNYRGSVYELEDWVYTADAASTRLLRQFDTATLKGFGVERYPNAMIAAGSLLHYLDLTGHEHTSHITNLSRIDKNSNVHLDKFTMRNLEIISPLAEEGVSLVDVIDKTVTSMGRRQLIQWLMFPLTDIKEINRRHDIVDYFFSDPDLRREATETIRRMGDMQRLSSKVSTHRAGPRDLLQLAVAVESTGELIDLLSATDSEVMHNLASRLRDISDVAAFIHKYIDINASVKAGDGTVINRGIDEDFDRLRDLRNHSDRALAELQQRETETTGIASLKIGNNNVFGYYLEVRNTYKDKVPETWIRKQTLSDRERYITPELKQLETEILEAANKISIIECNLFEKVLTGVAGRLGDILRDATVCAGIDCLLSYATAAECFNYVRPVVDDSRSLEIKEGRHPVIERQLPPGDPYISNSVQLDPDHRQIMMITGPNMSGKSALLRQTALIVLMAQAGSFVPAESAHIGLVDKIFTRVGASDNIALGESTFMVEMTEAASILNNMSDRSLILFDELGRGTSTYDGISIARAIVEHIHNNGRVRPKTLFATHYHELNEMEKDFPRIVNYNVSVKEIGGKVVFLRKLERGGSEHSFGIHVARIAGMPRDIVKRADAILLRMEADAKASRNASGGDAAAAPAPEPDRGMQLSLFQLDDPLLSQIRDRLISLDIDNLTPLMALATLHDLQSLITGK